MLTLLVALSLTLITCCVGQQFYVYDWANSLDTYPSNENMTRWAKYKSNHGAGAVIHEEIGLYNTFSYALQRIAMSRLLTSPHRTRNASQASVFFIPYDMGVDAMIDSQTGKFKLDRHNIGHCRLTEDAIHLMTSQATEMTFKHNLHDHVVIFSISHGHPLHSSCKKFFSFCYNCTFFTTNTYPKLHEMTLYTARPWFSIPYASSWHWSDVVKELPWEGNHTRPYLITFVGSTHTENQHSNRLRARFLKQCNNSALGVHQLGQQDAHCHLVMPIEGRFTEGMEDLSVYRNSVFCLSPPGDNPARKATFDIINAGCIPVFLSHESFDEQYYLHLTKVEKQQISVTIDSKSVLKFGLNIVHKLKGIAADKEKLLTMQSKLREISPRLNYAIPPNNFDDRLVWSPPFKDAVDTLLERLLKYFNHLQLE